MQQSPSPTRDILIITAQIEPPVSELMHRLGGDASVEVFCSGAADVWGERRGKLAKAGYFVLDPLLTMLRMASKVWRYRLVICYYHRNGYWLGIVNGLIGRRRGVKLAWVGFAPNPKVPGLRGWVKELITRQALSGCDLVICNARPLIEAISLRYPGSRDSLAFVRWGGGAASRRLRTLKTMATCSAAGAPTATSIPSSRR